MSISSIGSVGSAAYTPYASASSGITAAPGGGSTIGATCGGVPGEGAFYSASSTAMTSSMGGMAEQVMQLLMAAFALQAFGGGDKQEDDDKSTLGLALALAVMGQQQHTSFATSSATYASSGQMATPYAGGGMVDVLA